jgi:thiazole synthase
MVTVVKRIDSETDAIISHLKHPHIHLPNTSGARNAKSYFSAQLAREALETNWLKLKFIPIKIPNAGCNETLKATGHWLYRFLHHADPVLCKHLEEAGTAAVMPCRE